jgi:hypothetical protein
MPFIVQGAFRMGPISVVAYFFLVVLPADFLADFLADFFAGFFIYYHLLSYHSCLIPRFLMRYKKPLRRRGQQGWTEIQRRARIF